MSLPLLVAIVAVGIALAVAAVHFTGGSKHSEIAGADHARQLFLADFPSEQPGHVEITADHRSAFLDLSGGRVGIVQSFGDGFFTRKVSAADVAAIRLRETATVSIRFRDFTWTGGHFHFSSPNAAAAIFAALDPERAVKSGA
jgi:hypothetical protein